MIGSAREPRPCGTLGSCPARCASACRPCSSSGSCSRVSSRRSSPSRSSRGTHGLRGAGARGPRHRAALRRRRPARGRGGHALDRLRRSARLATGDQLFYVGAGISRAAVGPGAARGVVRAGRGDDDRPTAAVRFRPPGRTRTLAAVSQPLRLEPDGPALGTIVVAKAQDVVRDQWAPSSAGSRSRSPSAELLAWLLGSGSRSGSAARRGSRPRVRRDRLGNYAVQVPIGRGGDEISHLSERFNEMAARLAAAEGGSASSSCPCPTSSGRRSRRSRDMSTPCATGSSTTRADRRLTRGRRERGDPARAPRRRRARPREAACAPLHRADRGGGHGAPRRAGVRVVRRRGPPPGDRLRAPGRRERSDDHHRRRSRVPGDHEPPEERIPLDPRRGRIGVSLDASNGAVRVDVTDSGPGISREDAQRSSSPFVSHDTQGTGLGLPIARELAGALEGRIELDTEPGRGSRFRLVLPARSA